MSRVDVLIIGAGQAGLALSARLAARGVEHVLLERGRVAERWRARAWRGLRLITPNWMTRLPGHAYEGPDPDGFMDRDAVVALLANYATKLTAPVVGGVAVRMVAAEAGSFRVATDAGDWWARAVVIATGACHRPRRPDWAAGLPAGILQVDADAYVAPEALPPGGALVVGASASGAQIAREIRASGRPVTLAVGRHVALPRRYRGRDVMAWMDSAGVFEEPWRGRSDRKGAPTQPSLQLSGSGAAVDLGALAGLGVRLAGRALGFEADRVRFAYNLAADCAAAELRRRRTLARIDLHIAEAGLSAPVERALPAFAPASPGPAALDLLRAGVASVVWATGYRRDYGWLRLPVVDVAGELVHGGGVTPWPGLFALGLPFMRTRASTFIDGVGRDAEAIAAAIDTHLATRRLAA